MGRGGAPEPCFLSRLRSASSTRSLPMYSRIAYSANGPLREKANESVARSSGGAARVRGGLKSFPHGEQVSAQMLGPESLLDHPHRGVCFQAYVQ